MGIHNISNLDNRQQDIDFDSKFFYSIIIGVGGIGSWVGLNLALSGRVENIVLIDPDIVEETNLNRTPYRIADINNYKVFALKYLILERRCMDVYAYNEKSSKILADNILNQIMKDIDATYANDDIVIVDCRDDIFDDFYHIPCKYIKLGYDGLQITMDGNPKNTPVWGQQNSYRYTPSFICPSQLAANLIVNDLLTNQIKNTDDAYKNYMCDENGKLNDCFTIDTQFLMRELYLLSKKGDKINQS